MDTRRIATLAGWPFVATFVTSIPAQFIFYAPVLDKANHVTGAGADASGGRSRWGGCRPRPVARRDHDRTFLLGPGFFAGLANG